ncbi:MAG TPA: hypothetical protein ENK14_06420 [Caldithrix sp.]|nr:hypothetical protein [Caldithrix sp.]
MNRIIVLLLIVLFSGQLLAQVNINGYVKTYNRLRLKQDGKFTWNENQLGLKFGGNPSEKIHYYSEVRLRAFGFPGVVSTSDLQRREKDAVQPWGMEFREAYIDLYGFLTANLDLRIGRQRIVWGTADKLNPTDNLNPDDLEDIFDFGRHLGSNALQATYYLGDYTFYGIYIPVFSPAILPYGDWADAFAAPVNLPPGMILARYRDHINLPENKLSETSAFGFKAAGNLFNYDWSLSYYYGRDDLPLVSSTTLIPYPPVTGGWEANAILTYPRLQVIGADMAGSIGSVGVWAEGALTIPHKIYNDVTIHHPVLGNIADQQVALDNEPYFKYVVGGDYTFKNGWYVNAQFMHGFIHERGAENLNDYLLMRFEKKTMNDALKIVPLGLALAIPDWGDVRNNYGIAGGPELDYYPIDALEISLGAYIIDGKGDNIFSRVKNFDEGFIKVTYDF